MRIRNHDISPATPYVIAEIGVNHDGDVERALALVDVAARVGANAIKMQYFETDRLMSSAAKLAAYQRAAGETDPVSMLRRLELSLNEMARVVDRAHSLGIHAIVTVFSVELVKAAGQLPWDAFKSASPDIVNQPLLQALAGVGRPMIVSTGAADASEVSRACEWLRGARDRLALLHCVSCYPTDPADAHIAAMAGVRDAAEGVLGSAVPVGYSDHTAGEGPGVRTGAVAVMRGAAILEKHLTDDRTRPGPDHVASCDPDAMAAYIWEVRAAARGERTLNDNDAVLLGGAAKVVLACEADVRAVSRQSLVATRAIAAGEVISLDDLTIKRPGTGIPPWALDRVVGARTARAIGADMPIQADDLASA